MLESHLYALNDMFAQRLILGQEVQNKGPAWLGSQETLWKLAEFSAISSSGGEEEQLGL